MNAYLFHLKSLMFGLRLGEQLTVDLAEAVLNLLEKIPLNEHIRLISQMEAAATSPAQNIAGSAP